MDLESKIQFAFLLGLLAGVIISAITVSCVLRHQHRQQIKQIDDALNVVLAKRKFSTPLWRAK